MKKYLIGPSKRPLGEEEGGEQEENNKSSSSPHASSKDPIPNETKRVKVMEKGALSEINAHERDSEITFFEDGHYYVNHLGERFRTSVSGIKGFIFPPFAHEDSISSKFQNPQRDAEGKLILKNGRSVVGRSAAAKTFPEDYGLTRRECIEKQRATSSFGTMVHLRIEKYLELQLDPAMPLARKMAYFLQKAVYTEEESNIAKQVIDAEAQWVREGWSVYRTEWTIFNEDFNLAGQIDVCLRRRGVNGYEYAILDWKTTRHRMSSCFSWKNFPNAFYPFHRFKATLGNQYLIQMALYAQILTLKYGMRVVMVRAVGLHQSSRLGETKTWLDIPFAEVNAALVMWNEFIKLERLIKEWEETGNTADDLFPTLLAPPYFKRPPGDLL
jgi:hypothetical protein